MVQVAGQPSPRVESQRDITSESQIACQPLFLRQGRTAKRPLEAAASAAKRGHVEASRFAAVTLIGTALLTACAATTPTTRPSTGASSGGGAVLVPWQPGNADAFQAGAAEERRTRAAQGFLPVTIYRPEGAGPFPFIVLLHGCGGLYHEAMWKTWVTPWAELFRAHGIGTAVVDSFTPRGVDQVCTRNVAAWAVRRADDAYSVRGWLAEQPVRRCHAHRRHGHVERGAHRAGGVAHDAEAPAPVRGRRRALSRLPDRSQPARSMRHCSYSSAAPTS